MVVDRSGRFMTQRAVPSMARLQPTVTHDALEVSGPAGAPMRVPLQADAGRREITVWKDSFQAIDCGDEAAQWLAQQLGSPGCRLVRMADDVHRRLDPTYVSDAEAGTAFADGYPLLLANEASLAELNQRLRQPVPMNRFRPNVEVSGPPAWAEEAWAKVRLGALELDAVKPCSRCAVITTDQLTGERPGPEPLQTLASYRTLYGLGAIFGMNLVPKRLGTVQVGDAISAQ